MAEDFALVRIVRVKNYDKVTKLADIDVKQLKTDYNGDVTVLNEASGTDVTIALAKKLTSAGGWKYVFDTNPICIDPPGSTVPCREGDQLPGGFKVSAVSAAGDSFTLSVPQLATGMVSYKYRLFMTRTKGDDVQDVIIDPRITNGGVGFANASSSSTWKSPADLSAETLVLLAILLLAAGTAFGWVLSGGRRP
jgi:hypothetical protein